MDAVNSGRRLLCDAMLGSLARWLRLLGYDTVFPGTGPSDDLVLEIAQHDGRWLVTRDRELASKGPRTMLVRSETLEDQLVEVLGRLGESPDPERLTSRCSVCNGILEKVDVQALGAGAVPPYVRATITSFTQCLDCGRVYWLGTHAVRIQARLNRVCRRLAQHGRTTL